MVQCIYLQDYQKLFKIFFIIIKYIKRPFSCLNNKKLSIQSNNKIDDIQEDMKPGQIKRLFAGGLKSKLQSRIVLNKFIERVA